MFPLLSAEEMQLINKKVTGCLPSDFPKPRLARKAPAFCFHEPGILSAFCQQKLVTAATLLHELLMLPKMFNSKVK